VDSYEKCLDNLCSVSTSLNNYLSSLPAESWHKPSGCDRWQVADVSAHLVFGAESYVSSVSRGVQGDPSPPPGRMPDGSDAAGFSAERIASGAITASVRLGDQLLPTSKATDRQLYTLLAGLNQPDRDRPCYHGGSNWRWAAVSGGR